MKNDWLFNTMGVLLCVVLLIMIGAGIIGLIAMWRMLP